MVNFKISNINKYNNKHTHNNIINQLVITFMKKHLLIYINKKSSKLIDIYLSDSNLIVFIQKLIKKNNLMSFTR